ncbi:hypothetical protein [Streptomyces virginiae]|uniref:Uncharacterized protein n=1 Tax=Streptomyces virginiae TaxID=1961 RepID=A0ABZ1TR72_STRVG|nr:hypothetical protein [Streptomyces virginiae]
MPELIAPTTRLHSAWLEARTEWGPGLHEDGFGLEPADEVDSAKVIGPLLAGRAAFGDPERAKRLTELLTDSRRLNRLPAYFLAYGALRERPPKESLR